MSDQKRGVPKDVYVNGVNDDDSKDPLMKRAPVIVSVDFGTSASAVAIGVRSSKHIAVFSPLSLPKDLTVVLQSQPDTKRDKVPTKVLLDAKTYQLVAFGDEAANRYDTALKDGLSTGRYLLFEHFKMRLDLETASASTAQTAAKKRQDILISARCGTPLPLFTVLTETLKHFRLTAQAQMVHLTETLWVLTVPTNWQGAAKQIMLEAAHAAGMTPIGNVILALESEAAAVAVNNWINTKQTIFNKDVKSDLKLDVVTNTPGLVKPEDSRLVLIPGQKCAILDVGGGTCDITVHKVDSVSGQLTEASHSGGSCGSIKVDKEFDALLDHTFGGNWMRTWEDQFPVDARALSRSIEALKREIMPVTINTDQKMEYRLRLPDSFIMHSGLANFAVGKNTVVLLDTQSDPFGTRGRNAAADAPKVTAILSSMTCYKNKLAKVDHDRKTAWSDKMVDLKQKNVGASEAEIKILYDRLLADDNKEHQQKLDQLVSKPEKITSGSETDEFEDILGGSKKLRVLKDSSDLTRRLTYSNGYLRFTPGLAESMFTKTVNEILDHLRPLCQDKVLSTIFMVGGFSESPVLRHAIQKLLDTINLTRSSQEIVLVSPPDPITSVLIGAVLYGIDPESVRSRVMRHTIGLTRAILLKDGGDHPSPYTFAKDRCEKTSRVRFGVNGQRLYDHTCHGHFRPMVKAGEVVQVFDRYTDVSFPAEPGQTEMVLQFWSSTATEINRTDDPNVEFLASVTIPMPICDGGLNRKVRYSIAFGGTHIVIKARDGNSGKQINATINFLD